MQIETEKIQEWKKWLDHGDKMLIATESGRSYLTICNALNKGIATTKTIEAINAFVEKKKQSLAA
jgi:hypothetical protein